ncbi:hypothetical protein FHT40_005229 [Mycolicibacterium sp. BK556]|nr:hypothetical protein [Mycolicibacterium sp. BK556]MBB3635961.1 hypothetical protein [Mycolicibacterium sp. BK607]
MIYLEIVVLDALYVALLAKAPRYQRELQATPAVA